MLGAPTELMFIFWANFKSSLFHFACQPWARRFALAFWYFSTTGGGFAEHNFLLSPAGQNGCHFVDDIFKCMFMNEKFCILIWISMKFASKGSIDNKSSLVQATSQYLKQCWNSSLTHICSNRGRYVITWRLNQNGCHFADDIFRSNSLYEICCILIQISLKFVPKGPISNKPALVKIIAPNQTGNKPLSEPVIVQFVDACMCHLASMSYSIITYYRQVSNIRRTKSQHLKDSRTVLWLSLPNPLKTDVKSRMKM